MKKKRYIRMYFSLEGLSTCKHRVTNLFDVLFSVGEEREREREGVCVWDEVKERDTEKHFRLARHYDHFSLSSCASMGTYPVCQPYCSVGALD